MEIINTPEVANLIDELVNSILNNILKDDPNILSDMKNDVENGTNIVISSGLNLKKEYLINYTAEEQIVFDWLSTQLNINVIE
jgi:hypothetical protein